MNPPFSICSLNQKQDWGRVRLKGKLDMQDMFLRDITTVEAYEIMNEAGIKREDRYKYVDQIAATIILEDYLNSHR